MRSTVTAVAMRLAISASLAVSGVIHAYLYVNGYRDIPTIGPAFLGQAIVFCVLALLILAGGPDWLRWVGGALSAGALVAFALRRALRIRRTGMEPITAGGGQRDR
jgi:membrane associated rhomboid family serine protease